MIFNIFTKLQRVHYAEQPEQYYSTFEEADSRIWQHAVQSQATNILIYSPILMPIISVEVYGSPSHFITNDGEAQAVVTANKRGIVQQILSQGNQSCD